MAVQKIQQATGQCDQLFWNFAHEFIKGFPQMRKIKEVKGKAVENMVLDQKLGHGAFGTVYGYRHLKPQDLKDSWKVTGAVKVISKAQVRSLDQLFAIHAEFTVLQELSGHPNVVEAYSLVHGEHNLYIFMELVGSRNLYTMLRFEWGVQGFSQERAHNIFKCIADGVAHCHKHKFAHCDLKPENVVMMPDDTAKIVDFGEVQDLSEEITPLTCPRGTMPFMAPEVLYLKHRWNPAASDVWSLGVLLMELVCGFDALPRIIDWPRRQLKAVPERADELMKFFADFRSPDSRPLKAMRALQASEKSELMSDFTIELLAGMLQLAPEDRYTASSLSTLLYCAVNGQVKDLLSTVQIGSIPISHN